MQKLSHSNFSEGPPEEKACCQILNTHDRYWTGQILRFKNAELIRNWTYKKLNLWDTELKLPDTYPVLNSTSNFSYPSSGQVPVLVASILSSDFPPKSPTTWRKATLAPGILITGKGGPNRVNVFNGPFMLELLCTETCRILLFAMKYTCHWKVNRTLFLTFVFFTSKSHIKKPQKVF